ncbi:uncharacterized protein zgc:66479 isoform X2 [Syngnathoides biaculeatus]|uniref:uncharacterized protein zgc:66479 isoform X2 n=1 Tax=Syngnathoides biaculeatus TaxID=300417 RepID=UPI002ADD50E2|nr:uncharacterized protein zgc:66479 isoform X2 [Syngnathoides biaculeatus]
MTAKHRKGKGNHKHEEDHVKSDIPESEVRSGGNSHAFALFLCLVVVFGGATGTWFCYQQHLTMTHLTESLTGMQMKVVKLQASQETARQTNDMVHFSTDVESRLNALEESYAMAQKQVDGALASTEHLKALDLPAQVLSLHTEVKSRLAEIQQSVASAADLTQLQVQAAMGRVEKAEAVLDDVDSLRHILKKQTAHLMGLQIELKSYQTEMAAFRESLETERSAQFQQADVEEQISAVRMSVQEQNSTTGNLHAELRAQLDNLQKQVSQIAGAGKSVPEPMQKAKGEPATVVEKEEEAAEKRSNLVAVESGTDEPVEEASDDKASSTEHMEQSLTSPETAETPGTDAEGEEVILSDKKRFVEELPLDKGEAHPEEDDYDDDDDRSAEQDESEEELDNDEL